MSRGGYQRGERLQPSMSNYDSTEDTNNHISRVRHLLGSAILNLQIRSDLHDASKLKEPEKSTFDYATPRLAGSTYGSEEYKGFLAELKPALDHHYALNPHHPEHYKMWRCPVCETVFRDSETTPSQCFEGEPRFCPQCCRSGAIMEAILDPHSGIDGMSLLDLLEMLCDWKAAGERHKDGSIERSLSVNRERFKISPQLQRILENTAIEMGWMS